MERAQLKVEAKKPKTKKRKTEKKERDCDSDGSDLQVERPRKDAKIEKAPEARNMWCHESQSSLALVAHLSQLDRSGSEGGKGGEAGQRIALLHGFWLQSARP